MRKVIRMNIGATALYESNINAKSFTSEKLMIESLKGTSYVMVLL